MAYSNQSKTTSQSYLNDDKQTLAADTTIPVGTPIGLLLTLTYATQQSIPGGYTNTDKTTSSSYSNDSEQTAQSYSNDGKETSQSYLLTSKT